MVSPCVTSCLFDCNMVLTCHLTVLFALAVVVFQHRQLTVLCVLTLMVFPSCHQLTLLVLLSLMTLLSPVGCTVVLPIAVPHTTLSLSVTKALLSSHQVTVLVVLTVVVILCHQPTVLALKATSSATPPVSTTVPIFQDLRTNIITQHQGHILFCSMVLISEDKQYNISCRRQFPLYRKQ
jgi:hypothetical protein